MAVKWLMVLPLLVDFNTVTLQPTTKAARQSDLTGCCPCPGPAPAGPDARSSLASSDDLTSADRPCEPRAGDAEGSASFLLPALRAMQPYVQSDQKTEPKPLLQPEVGLASSVLETLRQVTDEEYQDALARDAARSAVKLIESTLDSTGDELFETPNKKVRIFLNTVRDDMDDNLPEPSHVQETRCIHSPLQSIHSNRQLSRKHPAPIIEVTELFPKPRGKLSNKSILHRKFQDMDNGISASNIAERVTPPLHHDSANTNLIASSPLLNILKNKKIKNTKNIREFATNMSDVSQIIQPKLHLKLRELIDNLDIMANKEKFNVPVIDLKKYISTTAMPPLKLKSAEKSLFNIQPLLPKHLLKLKDVELIHPYSITKNTGLEKSLYPSLRFQSDNLKTKKFNTDNFYIEDNSSLESKVKQNNEMNINSISANDMDTEISPSNSNLVFESNTLKQNAKPNVMSGECTASFENRGINIPMEVEHLGDSGEIKLEESSDKEQLSDSDNCIVPTEYSFTAQSPNVKNERQNLKINSLQKDQAQNFEKSEDVIPEESKNDGFQIELLEDFDTLIEYDNSSFNPKSYMENDENIQHANDINKNTLSDPVGDTSNNSLQIENLSDESPYISQTDLKKIGDDCYSQVTSSRYPNFISAPQNSIEKTQEINSMQQVSSEDDTIIAFNKADDVFSDIDENPSQVSFRDLQDISNSILSLSECEPPTEENLNTNSNQIEDNKKSLDYNDEDHDTQVDETNFQKKETSDNSDIKSNLNTNIKVNELFDIGLTEKVCKSAALDEITFNLNNENKEMQAEASEPESKLLDPATVLRNSLENNKKSKTSPKTTASINKTAMSDKHSEFLSNVRSKLESLFSTTERESDVVRSLEDNTNESSNMNPAMTKFDKLNKLIKLQHRPQTLLEDISQSKLSGIPLKPYKNKLALPSNLDPNLTANSLNFLKFPSEVSNPFQNPLDPSLSFTALSDKLRSHTENAIQNVKETLGSTLKDSQIISLRKPTDTIDTQDILEQISNRRDEMKEKLEALHLDLNDRFSSFHDSLLDHFNTPLGENFQFQKQNDNLPLLGQSYTPIKKEPTFPAAPKLRNVHHKHNFLPQVSVPRKGKNTDVSFTSPTVPTIPDAARFRNFDRKLSQQNDIPKPKVLKAKVDSSPRFTEQTSSKPRPSKIPIASDVKADRSKSLFKEPYIAPSSSSKINVPFKTFKTKSELINKDESPVNKLRNTLLQRNQNHKKNKGETLFDTSSSLYNDDNFSAQPKILLNRKETRPKLGSRNNENLVTSATSHADTTDLSRLVEPMRENVPYKCKLICYKDS